MPALYRSRDAQIVTIGSPASVKRIRDVDPDSWYGTLRQALDRGGRNGAAALGHSGEPAAPPDMGAPEKGLRILLAAPGSDVLKR